MALNLIEQFSAPETALDLGKCYYARDHDLLGNMMEVAPTIGDIISCWTDHFALLHTHCRIIPEANRKRIRLYVPQKYPFYIFPEELVIFLLERDFSAGISIFEKRLPGVMQKINPSISFSHALRTSLEK
ncbi:hypothetical protein SAMN02746065_11414 [Desulfocicer vacuolatum DSM 3385]|uniref:Uncharacterized protein n=2 Tax=Desulfocicer vacuolatum TaxID=2298 RepID=A0A1W2CWE9_9BACT|nr:hypothetical protein SAMN02746065_11414 [Desulfocicer vacuolatum DSM 3385]